MDGSDIRTVTRQSLRHQYGMVLQDTWLKSGTVRENIRLAKPDAADEEVETAAKKAHADSFIRRLPNGYDTMLSDTGGALSAGQRQLLCIARVMLCLPPMLILDEATSSIDTRTEVKIQQAFDTMMQARTSFVVAHRRPPSARRTSSSSCGTATSSSRANTMSCSRETASTPSCTTVSSKDNTRSRFPGAYRKRHGSGCAFFLHLLPDDVNMIL